MYSPGHSSANSTTASSWVSGNSARQSAPYTFGDLRDNEEVIRVLEAELEDRYGKPLYAPFETGNRAIRPKQAYLTKLPAELVSLFPQLQQAAEEARSTATPSPVAAVAGILMGEDYRRPDEDVLISETDPFSRDPALVERGLRSHAVTQNLLADHVEALGAVPRSPRAAEPNFDLAWEHADRVYVTEVKSINDRNEERQLRLGLGQVLRYRHALKGASDRTVVAVVATSRQPADSTWQSLLKDEGVVLIWPEAFDRLGSVHGTLMLGSLPTRWYG
jgi:hypothetical protein